MEENEELPKDGLNGECAIHYGDDNRNYEWMVTLVNEGMAILFWDGVPCGYYEYRSGILIGRVTLKRILSMVIHSKESILYCDIGMRYSTRPMRAFVVRIGWMQSECIRSSGMCTLEQQTQ